VTAITSAIQIFKYFTYTVQSESCYTNASITNPTFNKKFIVSPWNREYG